MSQSLYLYVHRPLKELKKLIEEFQDEFDVLLGDTFSEAELSKYERLTDDLSPIEAQPIFSELTFDDFTADPQHEVRQRDFFARAQSCVCLERLPYLETNPFQVTYLKNLVWSFDEVLIDRGGVNELLFRSDYLQLLKGHKTIDDLIVDQMPIPKKEIVSSPVDQLVNDIYRELKRIEKVSSETLPEKTQKLLLVMIQRELTSTEIFKASGLNPKDFEDHLEKLKFFLRKL